jgi:hypothetical protein
VTDGHIAFHTIDIGDAQAFRHKPHCLDRLSSAVICRRNYSGRLLPAMLKRIQAEV